MLRKSLFAAPLFFALVCTINADDFSDLLQDLAIQTACIGMYSNAQIGMNVTSRYDDPPDWYEPYMMANRFAAMSGNMTRTDMFYGICFDYAQFAWENIRRNQAEYKTAGMKDQQWYIAVANKGDPNTIILYDPVSREQATTVSNGVYLKENTRHKVYAHDNASGHAWLWIQHQNGDWYWIDPTWTDNTGYVWWGIVQNGKEVTYYPNPAYCIAESDYPKPGATRGATRSPDSTYVTKYPENVQSKRFAPYPGSSLGFYVGYISTSDFDFANKYGFTFSLEDQVPAENAWIGTFSVDYLVNNIKLNSENSLLLGLTLGYQMHSKIVVYAGGGLGATFPLNDEWFAWKINSGLRLQFGNFFTKFDASYSSPLGLSFSAGIGIFL
jgi:hypothetical protein